MTHPKDRVLGFDIRRLNDVDTRWLSRFPDYHLRESVEIEISLDPFVFPIPTAEETRRSQQHAIPQEHLAGLLNNPTSEFFLEPDVIEIAATMNASSCLTLEARYGVPLVCGELKSVQDISTRDFLCLGFDILEVPGLISGLWNCGPHQSESRKQFAGYCNKFGLFDEYSNAAAYCQTRSGDDHTFEPVAVWISPRSKKKIGL